MKKILIIYSILLLLIAGASDSRTRAQTLDGFRRILAMRATDPATCTTGELYWNTAATAGQNLKGCTSTNTWTTESGTPGPQGPPGSSGTGSGTVTVASSGNLTSTDCVSGAGTQVLQTPSANCTIDASGNLIANSFKISATKPVPYNANSTTSGNAVCQNAADGTQITDCGYVAVTNARTVGTSSPLSGGGALSANLTLSCPTCTVTIASGTSALGTAAIASGTCATVVTTTATGTATTDVVAAGFNSDVTGVTGYTPVSTGSLQIFPYPTTNNVNFKVCNPTSSSLTPGAVTLNWRVTR